MALRPFAEFKALQRRILDATTCADYVAAVSELPFRAQIGAQVVEFAQHGAYGGQVSRTVLNKCRVDGGYIIPEKGMTDILLPLLRNAGYKFVIEALPLWAIHFESGWSVEGDDLERTLLIAAAAVGFISMREDI